MKILDISEFYSERGGSVSRYTDQKFRAAARRGIELVVIAPGQEDHVDEREGGRIVWIKGPPMPIDPRFHLLIREKAVHTIVDLERPDLLEASSPWTSGWFAARYREPIPRAFIFHQDPIARYPHTAFDRFVERDRLDRFSAPYWAYLRRLSSRFDATIVASERSLCRSSSRSLLASKNPVTRPHFAIPSSVVRSSIGPGCLRMPTSLLA